MTTTQWIFVVFFAIFWGAVGSVQGRWKMFQWPLIHFPHVAARVVLSTLLLNICPVIFFAAAFYLLRSTPSGTPAHWTFLATLRQTVAGVTPAFAIFGFYRLWLGIVELSPTRFYQHEGQQDASIKDIDPSIERVHVGTYPWGNIAFGLLYILLAIATPFVLA
jgi:hypothetical protein